jgi:hypothetical protein
VSIADMSRQPTMAEAVEIRKSESLSRTTAAESSAFVSKNDIAIKNDEIGLEDDDLADMFRGGKDVGYREIGSSSSTMAVSNESAWLSEPHVKESVFLDHSSVNFKSSGSGTDNAWEKMAAEVHAKQERENQRKEEVSHYQPNQHRNLNDWS